MLLDWSPVSSALPHEWCSDVGRLVITRKPGQSIELNFDGYRAIVTCSRISSDNVRLAFEVSPKITVEGATSGSTGRYVAQLASGKEKVVMSLGASRAEIRITDVLRSGCRILVDADSEVDIARLEVLQNEDPDRAVHSPRDSPDGSRSGDRLPPRHRGPE